MHTGYVSGTNTVFLKTLNSKQKRFSVGMFFLLMWMVWDGVFRWLNPLCSLSLTLSFSRMFRIRSWWVIPCRAQPWKTPKFPVEHSAICKATTHNTLKQWHICLKTHNLYFFSHVGPNLIICFLWIETHFSWDKDPRWRPEIKDLRLLGFPKRSVSQTVLSFLSHEKQFLSKIFLCGCIFSTISNAIFILVVWVQYNIRYFNICGSFLSYFLLASPLVRGCIQ